MITNELQNFINDIDTLAEQAGLDVDSQLSTEALALADFYTNTEIENQLNHNRRKTDVSVRSSINGTRAA